MILASGSPRRKEILEGFGFNIRIEVLETEEKSDKIHPIDIAKEIAYEKGIEVAKKNSGEYVVSADTIVVLDEDILGKPKDKKEAVETLEALSGRNHKVITAFALFNIDKGIEKVEAVETEVKIKELTPEEINWYVESGEPLDKAGSYGIQGLGNVLVEGIEGDFYNVMGFPLSKFYDTLKRLGIKLEEIKEI